MASRTASADLELLLEKEPMYEPAAASIRRIRLPCLNDDRDSSLGPCCTTVGDDADALAVDLGRGAGERDHEVRGVGTSAKTDPVVANHA
jgi:hypothetical protein